MEDIPLTNEILGSMYDCYLLEYLSQTEKMRVGNNVLYDDSINSLTTDTNSLELSLVCLR